MQAIRIVHCSTDKTCQDVKVAMHGLLGQGQKPPQTCFSFFFGTQPRSRLHQKLNSGSRIVKIRPHRIDKTAISGAFSYLGVCSNLYTDALLHTKALTWPGPGCVLFESFALDLFGAAPAVMVHEELIAHQVGLSTWKSMVEEIRSHASNPFFNNTRVYHAWLMLKLVDSRQGRPVPLEQPGSTREMGSLIIETSACLLIRLEGKLSLSMKGPMLFCMCRLYLLASPHALRRFP